MVGLGSCGLDECFLFYGPTLRHIIIRYCKKARTRHGDINFYALGLEVLKLDIYNSFGLQGPNGLA
jgi:hypothetical protein